MGFGGFTDVGGTGTRRPSPIGRGSSKAPSAAAEYVVDTNRSMMSGFWTISYWGWAAICVTKLKLRRSDNPPRVRARDCGHSIGMCTASSHKRMA